MAKALLRPSSCDYGARSLMRKVRGTGDFAAAKRALESLARAQETKRSSAAASTHVDLATMKGLPRHWG